MLQLSRRSSQLYPSGVGSTAPAAGSSYYRTLPLVAQPAVACINLRLGGPYKLRCLRKGSYISVWVVRPWRKSVLILGPPVVTSPANDRREIAPSGPEAWRVYP